ncbi:hypothetical protein BSKO_07582 [Bryopsis sp. KO-2023]|nr:hypothetical protein BSKO_07582 [Bryopsis sp. KO-2023]
MAHAHPANGTTRFCSVSSSRPGACPLITERRRGPRPGRGTRKQRNGIVAMASRELMSVADVKGIRLLPGSETDNADVEYFVEWEGDEADSWEPTINLSPDLIRDFEDKWWDACRKHDMETLEKLMRGGGDVLAQVCDENGRTGLHFASAVGRTDVAELFLAYGADPNVPDKDGYIPLHMASGYLQLAVVQQLLDAGSDPDFPDENGRTPLSLMESLRDNLPLDNPSTLSRRMALERVISTLTDDIYETLEPVAILDMRSVGEEREYLVQWPDDAEDSWVTESEVAEDVKEDFEKGLEYGDALGILNMRNKGDERLYLIRWSDDHKDTWEVEENVSDDLIQAWEKGERLVTSDAAPEQPSAKAESSAKDESSSKNDPPSGDESSSEDGPSSEGSVEGGQKQPITVS